MLKGASQQWQANRLRLDLSSQLNRRQASPL
jgi:hypothetical protein